MARNVPRKNELPDAIAGGPQAERPQMPGGSSGAPPSAHNNAYEAMCNLASQAGSRDVARPDAPDAARKFRVTGGPPTPDRTPNAVGVIYEGARTRMWIGSVYPENSIDMPLLERQGVTFEEVRPPGAPAAPRGRHRRDEAPQVEEELEAAS